MDSDIGKIRREIEFLEDLMIDVSHVIARDVSNITNMLDGTVNINNDSDLCMETLDISYGVARKDAMFSLTVKIQKASWELSSLSLRVFLLKNKLAKENKRKHLSVVT